MTDLEKSRKNDAEGIPAKPKFPEGGLKGWLAVLACWCIMFNTFGYINAFGYTDIHMKVNSMLTQLLEFTNHIINLHFCRIKASQISLGLARYKSSSCSQEGWCLVL